MFSTWRKKREESLDGGGRLSEGLRCFNDDGGDGGGGGDCGGDECFYHLLTGLHSSWTSVSSSCLHNQPVRHIWPNVAICKYF